MILPAICLATGIAAAAWAGFPLAFWGMGFAAVLLVFILLQCRRSSSYSYSVLCLLFFLAGAFLLQSREDSSRLFEALARFPSVQGRGRVLETREFASGRGKSCVLDHVRLRAHDREFSVRGKVVLESSVPGAAPQQGDVMVFEGKAMAWERPRNPGLWNWAATQKAGGIAGRVRLARGAASCTILARDQWTLAERWQRAVARRWEEALQRPADAAVLSAQTALLQGMILGRRSGIDPALNEAFERTNTLHILAVSGQQMTLIFAVLFFVLRAAGLRRRGAALISIPIVLLYASIVGWQASVARAAVMIVLVLIGLAMDRRVSLLRMLALAALILLMLNPCQLWDVGFQLSFVAVLFLLLFTPAACRWATTLFPGTEKSRVLRWAVPPVMTSLIAWAATGPLIAWYFQWFSPITLLANVFIVGWVSLVTIPLGFLSLLLGSAWIPLAYPFNAVNGLCSEGLIAMTKWLASWPWASVRVASPGPMATVFYYGFFAVLALRDKIAKQKRILLLGVLAALSLFSQWVFMRRLECVIFDVGQGDAVFLRFPNAKNMLVDSGSGGFGRAFEKTLDAYLRTTGSDRIDYLVMSHAHEDHIGAMPALLQAVPVGQMLGNGDAFGSLVYQKLLRTALQHQVPLTVARGPSAWLQEAGARVHVLYPFGDRARVGYSGQNNRSVVLRVAYGGGSLLLPGDIEKAAESALLRRQVPLRSDVLKVPHHGGATSSNAGFLEQVAPRWAIISCGKNNKFGHPSAQALGRLQQKGRTIYRTDEDGAIRIRAYGFFWTLRAIGSGRWAVMLCPGRAE